MVIEQKASLGWKRHKARDSVAGFFYMDIPECFGREASHLWSLGRGSGRGLGLEMAEVLLAVILP
jgi:hypothetical protein